MADAARLRKVLAHLESLPESPWVADNAGKRTDSWNQFEWISGRGILTGQGLMNEGIRCGTAACFAGWACLLFGEDGVEFRASQVIFPSGEEMSVPDYAQELLGLEYPQALQLFKATNTLCELHYLVDRFASEGEQDCG